MFLFVFKISPICILKKGYLISWLGKLDILAIFYPEDKSNYIRKQPVGVTQDLWQEKVMAPYFSTLAWKIPWMEEPGRLQSMGSWRVGYDWATWLSLFHFHALKKEMATYSSVLAWRIPGTGEPGGLPSMGSNRVGHDWSDLAAAAAAAATHFFPNFVISNFSKTSTVDLI